MFLRDNYAGFMPNRPETSLMSLSKVIYLQMGEERAGESVLSRQSIYYRKNAASISKDIIISTFSELSQKGQLFLPNCSKRDNYVQQV